METTHVRQTFRSILRRPGYTLTAVLTLAVGIGASVAIFSLLHGALLRPLPYPDADRLIRVHNVYQATGGTGPFATPNYVDLARRNRTLQELAGYSVRSLNLATEAAPDRVRALAVTANFFDALGVRPVVGRAFQDGEDREGAARVAVIGARLWLDRFQGRRDVLGRTLQLSGETHTIVGVLPASFWFPGDPVVVLPFAWGESDLADGNRGSRWLSAFGRLRPGIGEEAARGDMAAITARIAEEFPGNNEGWTIVTTPFREFALGGGRTSLFLLAGAVGLVLLIGCVNVANLMLVRGERRQREMALRTALGAGRARLVRGFLLESTTLGVLAGVLGVGFAYAGIRLLLALYGGSLPRAETIGLSLPVLFFAAGLAVATGVAVGLIPSLRLDMTRLQDALRQGGGGSLGASSRLQRILVGGEVAVAVVLVAGAGLLMHSFWNLNRVETGVDPERAMVFGVELPTSGAYSEATDVAGFYDRALQEIARHPGVEHVGISPRVPLQGGYNITTLPSPDDPEIEASFVEIRQVSPDFFAAAGIPLLRGRLFEESEAREGSDVVVISDVLAETIFPDGEALGKRILTGWNDVGWEVVGIVGSVREFGVTRDRRPAVYWPYPARYASNAMTFVVRTVDDNPLTVVPAIRDIFAGLDASLPLYGIRTMENVVIETTGSRWFATTLFVAFGAVALALAALGIFGVLAYVVEQRTREIGLRMALGATRRVVIRSVVAEGVKLVGVGLVVGLLVAGFSSGLLAELLFEVEPTDPVTLLLVSIVAVGTGLGAAYLPARRAARLQPMEALREE